MPTSAEFLLAFRYLLASRRSAVLFLALFSLFGIALGVATLILVIGVMSGFQGELKRRILGINPHVLVTGALGNPITVDSALIAKIREEPSVRAVSEYVFTKSILRKGGSADGILVKGIEPGDVNMAELRGMAKEGVFDMEGHGIVLGVGLASRLNIFTGDTVLLMATGERETPVGPAFKYQEFIVRGVFDAGLYDFNENLAFVSARNLRAFTGLGEQSSGVELKLDDPYAAERVAAHLGASLPRKYRAVTWTQMNRSLFSALKLEKLAMFAILVMVVLIAAFNIITTLTMLGVEKTWEIGILRSMGMTRVQVLRVFTMVGAAIGALGTALGAGIGLGVSYVLGETQLISLPPDVYFIERLPVRVNGSDVVIIVVAALLITFFAALLPARRAARMNPVDAIARLG